MLRSINYCMCVFLKFICIYFFQFQRAMCQKTLNWVNHVYLPSQNKEHCIVLYCIVSIFITLIHHATGQKNFQIKISSSETKNCFYKILKPSSFKIQLETLQIVLIDKVHPRRYQQQNQLRHFAPNGLSDILPLSKRQNGAPSPPILHAMLCLMFDYYQTKI